MGSCFKFAWITIAIIFSSSLDHSQADYLTPNYYDSTCPKAISAIRKAVRTAIAKERRMAASLIRLQFHDCFVQGCDASVMLGDTPWFQGEYTAPQNIFSIRGFEVIEAAKRAVEAICPGIVSCADIIVLAARDSSDYVNGPTWPVKLGRRDSPTAYKNLATADLPFGDDNLDALISKFARKNFSAKEMVALSGAHTIGQAQCITFRNCIYNETNINATLVARRRLSCPSDNTGIANLAPLDPVTPNTFDNKYFKNLMQQKGLLHSDQVLFNGGETDTYVTGYSKNKSAFYADFAAAMVKLGDINPVTGSSGHIRRVCNVTN